MADSTPPDKLSVVVFSGAFDKVHYALAMASAAAAINRPVTLFFTMDALHALAGHDGWRTMPTSSGGEDGAARDQVFRERGVAGFEELLEACVSLGVDVMVCEMGLKAIGMDAAALRDDVAYKTGGIVTFLNDASKDGAMLFV
jgi:peroxiredoxin family protein